MQLCQHPFSFTKLYASDAPSKLPLREFLWGLVVKGSRSLRFGIRVSETSVPAGSIRSAVIIIPQSLKDLVSTEQALMFVLQVLIVLVTWLCVAPTLTCWLWRISFMRSFSQVRQIFSEYGAYFWVPTQEIT